MQAVGLLLAQAAGVLLGVAVLLGATALLAAIALLLVAVGGDGGCAAQAAVKYTKTADKTALNS